MYNTKTFIILLFLLSINARAQLKYSGTISLGDIAEAYEIKGYTVVQNSGTTKLYLMRADAEYGVKIQASKKTLNPGDTALLSIWFNPEKAGKFSKTISLVHSQSAEPAQIKLSGNLQKFKADDKTACFYFGEKHNQSAATLTALPLPSGSSNSTTPLPLKTPTLTSTPSTPTVTEPQPSIATTTITALYKGNLPENEFKPNNLIFLVDVSSSMRDSLKLPLMKRALLQLVSELREVDKLTFITYADTVKVLAEAQSALQKNELQHLISGLKAKGMTKGRKAILFSQQLAQQHYLPDGNNQIIIASDGQFKFEKGDQKIFKDRQGNKPVIISTIAFGEDKTAIKTLKSIAGIGKGSFIRINTSNESASKLIEEIKLRSKKDNR